VFTASLVVGVLLVVSRRSGTEVVPTDRSAWPLIAVVGLLDTGSNVLFLYATNQGRLTVVSILASLYPISTVILARVVLGERMNRYQSVGFVAALAATVLLGLA
jgi:drug/metabolite transporter (DMT)-like permease